MRGFTLLEIMISVAVIGIIASSGYPRLANFSQEVRLEEEAKILYNDLCLLQQATKARGIGTGTANFFVVDGVAGNPMFGYELIWIDPLDPEKREYIRPSFMDATMTRDLGSRNVCVSPASSFPISTATASTILFSKNGVPNGNFQIFIRYYEPESNRITEPLGTFSVNVDPDTRRLIFRDESTVEE